MDGLHQRTLASVLCLQGLGSLTCSVRALAGGNCWIEFIGQRMWALGQVARTRSWWPSPGAWSGGAVRCPWRTGLVLQESRWGMASCPGEPGVSWPYRLWSVPCCP